MNNPLEKLVRFLPKATAEEEAEAARLGLSVEQYRAMRITVAAEEFRKGAEAADDRPADIRREDQLAEQLFRKPGLFKKRNESTGLLTQASSTPGHLAWCVMFVALYSLAMALLVIGWGPQLNKLPGIAQAILLGMLIIPVAWLTSRLWRGMGERARDVIRLLVRFWPVTLLLGLLLLGACRVLLTGPK